MRKQLLGVLLAICFQVSAEVVQDLDADTMKALQETQDVLRNPALRAMQPEMKGPAGAALQGQLDALGGTSADQEKIYQMAAEILGDLAKQANGDPAQMEKILEQAKKNPEAFANSLTPQQQQQIKDLAKKLPGPGNGKLP